MHCPTQYFPAEQDKGIENMSMLSIFYICFSLVSLFYLAKHLKSMGDSVWWITATCQKMLEKLNYIERREMRAKLRCHELVRLLQRVLHDFNPEMDETYLFRHFSSEIG